LANSKVEVDAEQKNTENMEYSEHQVHEDMKHTPVRSCVHTMHTDSTREGAFKTACELQYNINANS